MTTGFDALAALADDAAFDLFGAPWRILPMKAAPNQRPAPDPSRTAFDLTAIFRKVGQRTGFSDQRQAMETGKGVGVLAGERGIGVRRSDCRFVPAAGDIAERLSDGARFVIVRREAYGLNGYDLVLSGGAA